MNTGMSVSPPEVEVVPGADDTARLDDVGALPVFKPNLIAINLRKGVGLPEYGGGTIAYEHGYIDGQGARERGAGTSTYAMVGRDEYCLGFRAGYFATDRKSLRAANDAAGKVRSC